MRPFHSRVSRCSRPLAASLSREEELALIADWQATRSQASFERLLRAYDPLIRAACRAYGATHETREVLYPAGVIGLMKALGGFDASFGARLGTHAKPWIFTTVRDARDVERGPLTLRHSPRRSATFRQIMREYATRGVAPFANPLYSSLSETERAFVDAAASAHLPVGGYGENGEPTLDFADDHDVYEEINERLDQDRKMAMINDALARLDARTADILRRRYFGESTLEDCAGIYGVTRERIRQLEARGLAQVRSHVGHAHPHLFQSGA